jgi:hypothetical protein
VPHVPPQKRPDESFVAEIGSSDWVEWIERDALMKGPESRYSRSSTGSNGAREDSIRAVEQTKSEDTHHITNVNTESDRYHDKVHPHQIV